MKISPIRRRRLRQTWAKLKESLRKLLKALPRMIVLILALVIVYWAVRPHHAPEWTGFIEYPQQQVPQQQTQPKTRTLWDWMDLLLVPLSLSFAVIYINQISQKREQEREEDQKREQALQDYFEEISGLLLEHHLYSAKQNDDVRFIAMALTNNVLARLDGVRKGLVLNFLFALDLIRCNIGSDWSVETTADRPRPVVAISKANLSDLSLPRGIWQGAQATRIYITDSDFTDANLFDANLAESVLSGSWFQRVDFKKANLSGCDLSRSVFIDCNLEGADLTDANLRAAIVVPEDLCKAKSLSGCVMYDGATYDPTKPLEDQSIDRALYRKQVE